MYYLIRERVGGGREVGREQAAAVEWSGELQSRAAFVYFIFCLLLI